MISMPNGFNRVTQGLRAKAIKSLLVRHILHARRGEAYACIPIHRGLAPTKPDRSQFPKQCQPIADEGRNERRFSPWQMKE